MIKYLAELPNEAVVNVKGRVQVPNTPIESATQHFVKIQVASCHCISKPVAPMPFILEDACQPQSYVDTDDANDTEAEHVSFRKNPSPRHWKAVRVNIVGIHYTLIIIPKKILNIPYYLTQLTIILII